MGTRKRIVLLWLCAIAILGIGGCLKTVSTDPNTGKTVTEYSVDAGTLAKYEKPVEAGVSILVMLTTLLPGLIPAGLATILASILGTYYKIKPKLLAAQTAAEIAYTASQATVLGIEDYKKVAPQEWEKLCQLLDAQKAKIIRPEDQLVIENFIRGLRGLSAKA